MVAVEIKGWYSEWHIDGISFGFELQHSRVNILLNHQWNLIAKTTEHQFLDLFTKQEGVQDGNGRQP
jgi:hypothetical protein